ncbi:PAS domain S-box protein [Desulfatirhabdium butyrativorans]|uniref:PAS domain S-box protein n=1 Tax=Desulfatirhabdium butyrativorans TaxID=340467 RepID=UPI00041B3644|nr:PAS domain S-box protein [Desulfatirhabdium butyrativorans]
MEETVSPASCIEALESKLQRVSESLAEAKRAVMEWETTFNASSDAFWILDRDHHVLRSNRAAETIFRKPVDAMIGRLCCEIVHGTPCPIPECPLRRARKTLRRETMELVVGDRCYQISVDPILDDEGRFDGAVHVVSDITDRKCTEIALQQSEAMYRDLVENSSVLICTHDLDGRVWSANRKAAQSLGYPDFDISRIASLNVHIQDYLLPEGRDLFPLYIEELKTKGVARGEMVVLDIRGNRRIWEYNNSLRTEGVEQPIVRGIAQDITERRIVEKELKRRLTYERLLSDISTLAVRVEELREEDWLSPFLECALEIMGKALQVSRTHIFEHSQTTDTMINTFEWCAEGISAQKQNLRDIPASSVQWGMDTLFREGKIRVEDVEEIPDQAVRDICRSQGILAFLAVPLHVGGRYFGMLGFDECKHRRKWPTEDVDLLFSISRIITGVIERKRNEEALRESEQRFRRIYEESPIAYQSLDVDGRIVDVNPAWLHLFGYDREEVIGKYVWEFFTPESRRVFETNFPVFRERGATHGREREIVHKDGRNMTVLFDGVWVRDKRGNPAYTHCVLYDITERKAAERALQRSEEDFHQLFEAESDAIFLIDNETGSLLRANQAACDMYGYSREELLAMKNTDLSAEPEETRTVTQETPPAHDRIVRIPMRWHRRKNGERFPVEITGRFFLRDEKPVHIAAIRDISERVDAEAEKGKLQEQLFHAQKLESVARLAGGVAHDFNNMLGVIIGRAEMAFMKAGPSAPLKSDIEDILKAARRSAELTRQLLAFARRQTAEPKVLDLNDTISEMLKMLRRLVGEDMRLIWMPGANLWPVKIDPAQVDQILANLCVNARDAGNALDGAGTIHIETRKIQIDQDYCNAHVECSPGDYVMLAVSDNGSGMNKETLSHIFEPFFTTKPVGEGTGLGLATVFGIVKQNGGFINVYSEPDHGTTFKIYLPRVNATVPEEEKRVEDISMTGSETVLIVEDEEIILNLGKQILEHFGYKVFAAKSPGEAIALVQSDAGPIDLLVTDVVMPEMNGKQLKACVKAYHPGIKVLFMSGYTSNVIQQKGILDEGIQFIQKPFSVRDFAEKVRKILDA